MQITKNVKRAIALAVLIVFALLAVWVWWTWCGSVSHAEIRDAIREESESVRKRVDSRCDAIERKLDRLIEMATPKLPDNMVPAE